MPALASYEPDRTLTDVEYVRDAFLQQVDESRFDEAVAQVVVPRAWVMCEAFLKLRMR